LTRKIFIRLLGVFVLLLAAEAVAMEFVFHHMAVQTVGATDRAVLWAALIALALVVPVAAWAARCMGRVAAFALRIADGDLSARLEHEGDGELSAVETALSQAAERLNDEFAELESSRQELAAMLDAMQEAVIAITPEGLVRWSNAVMQRIAGAQIQNGQPLEQFVHAPELLEFVHGALERGEVGFGRSKSLVVGRVFEISAAPLPSGGALAVLHDVTRIESAEKARREFVANVSHELRTPLTSIQGYVETLIEEPDTNPDTTREFLGVILKNAKRMSRLTEDLLVLASIESPDYQPVLKAIPASTLVKDAIDSLRGMVAESEVELEFAGAPDVPVMADPDRMSQVFGNLIENSLKYASSGRRIRVGACLLASEIQFTVQDFGPGIATKYLERIFERFYRVDKARSRESGGTGLGLAIVKHIVQVHGGRVWAESEIGHGAAFHFTLPLAQGDASQI
jgi:two-component system phosphate regulon sensor histidine kinase PhoR